MNHVERQNQASDLLLYRATLLYGRGSALVLGRNIAEAECEAFEALGTKDVLFLDAGHEALLVRAIVAFALGTARTESTKGRR
jgi:hypothetical protein